MVKKLIKLDVYTTKNLDKNGTYKVKNIVGGSEIYQLQFEDESGLIKVKIDEQIFKILMQKKRREETPRMAVERAILNTFKDTSLEKK